MSGLFLHIDLPVPGLSGFQVALHLGKFARGRADILHRSVMVEWGFRAVASCVDKRPPVLWFGLVASCGHFLCGQERSVSLFGEAMLKSDVFGLGSRK